MAHCWDAGVKILSIRKNVMRWHFTIWDSDYAVANVNKTIAGRFFCNKSHKVPHAGESHSNCSDVEHAHSGGRLASIHFIWNIQCEQKRNVLRNGLSITGEASARMNTNVSTSNILLHTLKWRKIGPSVCFGLCKNSTKWHLCALHRQIKCPFIFRHVLS